MCRFRKPACIDTASLLILKYYSLAIVSTPALFTDQIFKPREQREKCTVDTVARDAQIERINDLQDYIKKQRTDLESFDEALVKAGLVR